MKNALQSVLNIFRFHKKKILFLIGSIAFGILVMFPYDDLSDYITLNVSRATQSNVYLQFDGLSFGLLPQLGIKMENVLIESVYAPTLSVKTLGVAPKLSAIMGKPAAKAVAYGLFDGDATVDIAPSNQLDVEGDEMGVSLELDNVSLKELSKFLKNSYNLPITMNGKTNLDSQLFVDPTFKVQPKGDLALNVKNLDIPSSNLPLNMNGATMSLALPALKLSNLEVEGNIGDGKLFIKTGKIGGPKNDLNGTITGDLFVRVNRRGAAQVSGYDLKINLNIKDNLKRQLSTILGFIDFYQGIGEKYKFDSLNGIRYSMRVTSGRTLRDPPRITSY